MRPWRSGDLLLLHIHIGASPLAQALILPIGQLAGFRICLVGRPDGDPLPRDNQGYPVYQLNWEGTNRREEVRRVDWYCQANSEECLPADVRTALRRYGEPLLLTATLRAGIEQRRPLIEEILKVRPLGAETVVMPCENDIPGSWQAVDVLCRSLGAMYLRPLVNRIAVPYEPGRRDSMPRGSRITRTHDLGEWLVSPPSRSSELLGALLRAPEFNVVDDLPARLLRKRHMVNGGHLAVGIRGVMLRRRSLRVTAALPGCVYDVSQLHRVMRMGLAFSGQEPLNSLEYGLEHVCAYCEVDDKVARVMRGLSRADFGSFLEGPVLSRLTAPAVMTAAAQRERDPGLTTGDWLEPYRKVFDQLEIVLADLSSFPDGKPSVLRHELPFLDPERDVVALRAYEACLRGWESADAITDRVRSLRAALASHYVALGALSELWR
jgi:hypothetical protein